MDTKIIEEVNSIRAIACLCIVLLHSIQFTLGNDINYVLLTLVGLLAFGTPTFVFLSELILSRSYPDRLPIRFFRKRVIPILIPFIFISFFYAFVPNYNDIPHLAEAFALNLIGSFHGPWFILVILQFYVLHPLFAKLYSKVSPHLVLTVSLVINIAYLAVFNLIEPPNNVEFIVYIWDYGYWIPCVGWLFYFTLAFYSGKNYAQFIQTLKKHSRIVLSAPILAVALVAYDNSFGSLPYSSKRMDMIVFTVTMILALFLLTSRLRKQPWLLTFVSKYSFGIFLLHFFYIRAVTKVLAWGGFREAYINIGLVFGLAVMASIITVHLFNKLPYGKYVVGGIRIPRAADSNELGYRTRAREAAVEK